MLTFLDFLVLLSLCGTHRGETWWKLLFGTKWNWKHQAWSSDYTNGSKWTILTQVKTRKWDNFGADSGGSQGWLGAQPWVECVEGQLRSLRNQGGSVGPTVVSCGTHRRWVFGDVAAEFQQLSGLGGPVWGLVGPRKKITKM